MSAQKLSKSQIEAKEYVEKHRLDVILNEMLNSLIYNKCEYPTVFMIKFLAAKIHESELKNAGILLKHSNTSESIPESHAKHLPQPEEHQPELFNPINESEPVQNSESLQKFPNSVISEENSKTDLAKIDSESSKSSKSSKSSEKSKNSSRSSSPAEETKLED